MNGEEKIIKIIENIVKDNKYQGIQIGQLTEKGINIDNIEIPNNMLYWLDYLKKRRATKVNGRVESSGGETHTHPWTDLSEYIEPIKPGDYVAFCKINDYKYIVLGRIEQ